MKGEANQHCTATGTPHTKHLLINERNKIKILLRSGLGCGMISPERYFRGSASWFEAALKLYLWEVLQ